MKRRLVLSIVIAAVAVFALAAAVSAWIGARRAHSPWTYAFPVGPSAMKAWLPLGGTWEMLNGAIHNGSNDRGAKLVSGSTRWSDYAVRGDLHFDSDHGDMGLVIRSNDEEEGVDAYRGYYAGLRVNDGALVIGKADYGWLEAAPVIMPGGVNHSTWFHLTLMSVGCRIAAQAENLNTHQSAWVVLQEHPCIQSGRIALRSLSTGGTWRNLSVASADETAMAGMLSHVSAVSQLEYPKGEAEYSRLRAKLSAAHAVPPAAVSVETQHITHIIDLVDLPPDEQKQATIRGVVTLSASDLYLQDATAGILVRKKSSYKLNVGDFVEVTGLAHADLYRTTMAARTVQLLWDGAPVPPISITSSQAVSGAYDARFVEIESLVTANRLDPDGGRVLTLSDGVQSFDAIVPRGSSQRADMPARGSYVRVRGICTRGSEAQSDAKPFAIVLRSSDDLHVLAGPPWWNLWHIGLLFVAALALVFTLQFVVLHLQRWKNETITRERERLAHEIHDSMAQSFAGVGYQIQGIRKTLLAGTELNRGRLSDQLTLAYQLVRRSHEEASRTIAMLSPAYPALREDLPATLAEAARRIAGDDIAIQLESEGEKYPLPLVVANGFYHIGREAIVNAVNHAHPSRIVITLSFLKDQVALTIADNGCGFDFSPAKAGFGILSMQKRARDFGGTLKITSSDQAGTKVQTCAMIRNGGRLRDGLRWLSASILGSLLPRSGARKEN